jgi:hypothetical protein
MWRDPRPWYVKQARVWIANHPNPVCVLCGNPVNVTLSGHHPMGPTIEHTYPIRRIRVEATTWAECVAMARDQSLWRIAHRRCQSRQGAQVVNASRSTPKKLRHTTREW